VQELSKCVSAQNARCSTYVRSTERMILWEDAADRRSD